MPQIRLRHWHVNISLHLHYIPSVYSPLTKKSVAAPYDIDLTKAYIYCLSSLCYYHHALSNTFVRRRQQYQNISYTLGLDLPVVACVLSLAGSRLIRYLYSDFPQNNFLSRCTGAGTLCQTELCGL